MGGGTRPIGKVECAECARVVKGYKSRVAYTGDERLDYRLYPYPHRHANTGALCDGRYKAAEAAK